MEIFPPQIVLKNPLSLSWGVLSWSHKQYHYSSHCPAVKGHNPVKATGQSQEVIIIQSFGNTLQG